MVDAIAGAPVRALVFGATGAIGSAIATRFAAEGWEVAGVSRSGGVDATDPAWDHIRPLAYDPFSATPEGEAALTAGGPYHAVCWAQGANGTDNVYNVDLDQHLALYQANCLYILSTLKFLLDKKLLAPGARLAVISSIWQNLARQDKLSYCMTKAALQGLVLSASADLAKEGMLINAILPGALDTPMTRKNVAPAQLEKLSNATYFHKLPALEDVSRLALFLCSPQNTGITGQFIAADLGFSHVRLL
ncbi:SDR family oxidoreductase [Pseudoduganella ginsengisoli]|uniref:SDR family oxidoreductase n=1 Tax=Pseudoduganella ginsengisoli TaxID=1462440 RepID=A0A6L6PYM5_9BURK|nr:SDR family oxidoreductase [Pseudoduganella ginsengisoli]MTW02657.1 SDR family oxidoreductase [Pseudoduganella ginsengisoli]